MHVTRYLQITKECDLQYKYYNSNLIKCKPSPFLSTPPISLSFYFYRLFLCLSRKIMIAS